LDWHQPGARQFGPKSHAKPGQAFCLPLTAVLISWVSACCQRPRFNQDALKRRRAETKISDPDSALNNLY
jgi:hypothetical protein